MTGKGRREGGGTRIEVEETAEPGLHDRNHFTDPD